MTTSELVDALGRTKAKIAQLEAQAEEYTAELKKLGECRVSGKLYEAVVFTGSKSTVDAEVLRETLNPQFLDKHTKKTEFLVVKVTRRKDKP